MANFLDILNQPMDEIKPPKPLPPGEYLAIIDGVPETVPQRGKNNNPCVVFPVKLMQALNQDPSFQASLAEALDGKSLTDVKLNHTMWITPDAAYRLKQFLEDTLQINGVSSMSQAVGLAQGRQLTVTIGHYVSQREGEAPRIGMDIKATAKA